MSHSPIQLDPIVQTVARIVERDDVLRARLVIEVEKRHTTEKPFDQDSPWNWRQFWIQFACEHPRLTMLLPVPVLLYFIVIYQLIKG